MPVLVFGAVLGVLDNNHMRGEKPNTQISDGILGHTGDLNVGDRV